MKGRSTTAFLLAATTALLSGPAAISETNRLASDAVSANPALAGAVRARLREMGPAGLNLIFEENLPAIESMREGLAAGAPVRPEWDRLRGALDAVARQRDAAWSGLYWYTDFAAAKKAAQATGRPILSLRLLGNLDEELSWRTAAFSAPCSTRMPRSGRAAEQLDPPLGIRPAGPQNHDRLRRRAKAREKITGNSLHYVLSTNGGFVDVLPGLWGPREFLREIESARRRAPRGILEGNRASSSVLDARSLQLMRVKMRGADASAFARVVRNFEQSLAADTALNLSLRRTIQQWLSRSNGPVDLAALRTASTTSSS